YFYTPGAALAIPGRTEVDFLKNGGDENDTYLLTRTRIHLGYNSDWFHVFLETQDSTSTGDKRTPNLESELFNLRQGCVIVGDANRFPLVLKAGRQEMAYGNEYLIGTADWNNIGRTFDAIKLRYASERGWVDAFVSYPVVPRDNDFNFSNNYDTFSGIYGSSDNLIPRQQSQLYFLARNTSQNSPNYAIGALQSLPSPRDVYTIGARVKSLVGRLGNWDYTVEAAYQFGRFAGVNGAAPTAVQLASKRHRAYAAHADGGYTFTNASGTPRVGLEWNYASGSTSPNRHGTFDSLYPSTHQFSPIMDFYSWQNIQDARINFSMRPLPKLTLTSSYRGVWLASTSDSFYFGNTAPRTGGTPGAHNGYAVNPTYSRYVGMEVDLTAKYAVTSYASVGSGYGHFFRGDYIKQSLSAFGSSDADYVYLLAVLNF
ncbi:MAG TPA: alginate export family protein, partial [Verrucomicrobiae bacterium]|nr:alginate export family protein [Verrucomicrobiae bacterium]